MAIQWTSGLCGAQDPALLRSIAELVPPDAAALLEPYMATPPEFALARALGAVLGRAVAVLGGTAEVVARANEKQEVRAMAQKLQVPIAVGEVVVLEGGADRRPVDTTALRPALERHLRATGRAILRGCRGAAGSAVRLVERSPESVVAALDWTARRPHDRTTWRLWSRSCSRSADQLLAEHSDVHRCERRALRRRHRSAAVTSGRMPYPGRVHVAALAAPLSDRLD